MIPVNIPQITEQDIDAVIGALRDGWISGEGPVINQFENEVARNSNRKFGVAVSNGSDALDLAFKALNLRAGDEVILPSFTIISCLAPILRMGLIPVFVDSDPETWNMDIREVEASITKKTKAILAVHIYGLTVDMDSILKMAHENGIWVIEDAAEAQGLFYKGEPCGSLGDISTFSFYANKNLTTGEGGMALTNDPNLAERLRYYRNLTFKSDERFVHEDIGWNMRLSSLQAALGISQLNRLEQAVARRREIAKLYLQELSGLPGLTFQAPEANGSLNGYWIVGIRLENHPKFSNAKEVSNALAQKGIATRPFFYPLHKQPLLRDGYKYRHSANMEVSEGLYQSGFYVPNGLGMTQEMLDQAVKTVRDVLA